MADTYELEATTEDEFDYSKIPEIVTPDDMNESGYQEGSENSYGDRRGSKEGFGGEMDSDSGVDGSSGCSTVDDCPVVSINDVVAYYDDVRPRRRHVPQLSYYNVDIERLAMDALVQDPFTVGRRVGAAAAAVRAARSRREYVSREVLLNTTHRLTRHSTLHRHRTATHYGNKFSRKRPSKTSVCYYSYSSDPTDTERAEDGRDQAEPGHCVPHLRVRPVRRHEERVELQLGGGGVRRRRAARRAELRAGAAAQRRHGRGGGHPRARQLPDAARAPARAGGGRARAPGGGRGGGRRGRGGARRAPQRRRRQPRAGRPRAALLRHRPHLHGRAAHAAPLRPRQGGRAGPPGRAAAARHAAAPRHALRHQGGLRLQDGARQRGRGPLVAHLARQLARPQVGRAQVRGHDAPPVRVLGGLVPDRARLAARVPRVRAAADRRELLPERGGRERVRGLPRGAAAPHREADRDAPAGGDPRRRPAQVLRAARQGLPARAPRQDQDARALHVLALLHRLPRAAAAARQARGLPAQPLRGPRRGGAEAQVPDAAARRGARVHGVPDGARAAADAGADRGAGVPRAVRARAAAGGAVLRVRGVRVRVRRVRVRVLPRAVLTRASLVPNVNTSGARPPRASTVCLIKRLVSYF